MEGALRGCSRIAAPKDRGSRRRSLKSVRQRQTRPAHVGEVRAASPAVAGPGRHDHEDLLGPPRDEANLAIGDSPCRIGETLLRPRSRSAARMATFAGQSLEGREEECRLRSDESLGPLEPLRKVRTCRFQDAVLEVLQDVVCEVRAPLRKLEGLARGRSRPSARRTRVSKRRPSTRCVHRRRPELRRHEPLLNQRPQKRCAAAPAHASARSATSVQNLFAKAFAGHRVPMHKRTLKHGPQPLHLGQQLAGERKPERVKKTSGVSSSCCCTHHKLGVHRLELYKLVLQDHVFLSLQRRRNRAVRTRGRLPDQLKQGPVGLLARQALPHRPFGKWVMPYLSGKSKRAHIATTYVHVFK